MSIDFEPERQRYRVRWREAGRQRSRRFVARDEAEDFAASITIPAPSVPRVMTASAAPNGDGVYAYGTAAGMRWRFVFRQSDGSLTTRLGFASRSAAVAARRTAIEQVLRGEVRASRETSAEFWEATLEVKRPYVTPGTLQDYATQGRKPSTVVRRPTAGGDRRGPRAWLARGHGRAGRWRRDQRQDGQQRPHVPVDDAR
jgi:hypothetical protein